MSLFLVQGLRAEEQIADESNAAIMELLSFMHPKRKTPHLIIQMQNNADLEYSLFEILFANAEANKHLLQVQPLCVQI